MFFLNNYAANKSLYNSNELITHNEMYLKKELSRKQSYIDYQNPNFDRDIQFREDHHLQRWFDAVSIVAVEPVEVWLGTNFEYKAIQRDTDDFDTFYNKGDMEEEYIRTLNINLLKRYKDIHSLEARYEKFNIEREYQKLYYYEDSYIKQHKYNNEIINRENKIK